MNTDSKSSSGQRVKRVPSSLWNGMIGAGQQYLDRELGHDRLPPVSVSRTDWVKVKNSTGDERRRGEVVSLGELIVEDLVPESFWLDGKAPQRGKHFAVLKYDVQPDEIIDAQVLGLTIARVKVSDNSHRFARLPSANTDFVLESCSLGPFELLYSPEITSESEEECLVNLRSPSVGVFMTPSGGIAGRTGMVADSAECDTYWIANDGTLTELKDDDDNIIKTKIFNIFSGDVGGGAIITAKDVHGIAAVDAEDCG